MACKKCERKWLMCTSEVIIIFMIIIFFFYRYYSISQCFTVNPVSVCLVLCFFLPLTLLIFA